ncbi:uncharacterized protein ARMOST_19541 [Armillaria ostoyae]|uniref:Uncharacterized protein n=1 Tax=Armillaria ostoyae TaxID=47428 RepID=A0A284S4Z3_ARMOS|nr:uncharacterized protein ARMOST_19541 [Armillaria ostoyae]
MVTIFQEREFGMYDRVTDRCLNELSKTCSHLQIHSVISVPKSMHISNGAILVIAKPLMLDVAVQQRMKQSYLAERCMEEPSTSLYCMSSCGFSKMIRNGIASRFLNRCHVPVGTTVNSFMSIVVTA